MKLRFRGLVEDMLFLAVVLLVLSRFVFIEGGMPMPVSVISSGSMEPALSKGDMIIWVPCRAEDVKVGDVIVFKSYINENLIISHRVVKIEYRNGEPTFVTKGDNNPSTDQAGSHAVEPNIRANNLLGRVVSVGSMPLKFPHIGLAWLWMQEVKDNIQKKGMFAGPAILPFIITAGFILTWFVSMGKTSKKGKIERLITGTKKESLVKMGIQAFVVFLLIMLSTFLFAHSSISVSIGVMSPSEDANLKIDNMATDSVMQKPFIVSNNGFSDLKCVCFSEGSAGSMIDVGEPVYTMKPGDTDSRNVTIKSTGERGVYNGNIQVYSSPFWVVLPDDFMESTLEWNHEGAIIIFDLVSAIIMTGGTMLIIVFLTIAGNLLHLAWTYATSYAVIREGKLKDKGHWLTVKVGKIYDGMKNLRFVLFNYAKELESIEIDPNRALASSFVGLLFLPIALAGYTFAAILVACFVVGMVAYVVGCRKRAEVVLASCATVLVHVILFTLPPVFAKLPPLSSLMLFAGSIMYGAGLTLLYAGLLLIPGSALSYYGARLVLSYDIKRDPIKEIDENIDF